MASRAGVMQQAFTGTRLAMEGNAAALFNVARGFKAVMAGAGPLGWLLLAIGVLLAQLSNLWDQYKARQESAAQAGEKMAVAQKRLHDVIMATRLPNYDPNIKAIQAIASAYADAEEAAKNFKDAQDKTAAAKTAVKVANLNETAQRAIGAAAGDENKQAEIAYNARREIAAETYKAEYAAIERNAAAQEASLARIKAQMADLSRQDLAVSGKFSAPLLEAENEINKIRDKQVAAERSGSPITAESVDALAEATANRDRIKGEQEKARAQIDKQIHDGKAARAAAEQSIASVPEKKAQLAAEFSSQEAADNAAEATRAAAQDKLRIEKEILKTKEEITRQSEAEAVAVKATGTSRAEDLADEINILKIEQEAAQNEAARLRLRVLSSAAGQAQDQAAREAKREEDRVDKRIAAAEDARNRGGRGKWIDQALAFKGAREEAAAKGPEINALEQQQAVDIAAMKASLDSIKTNLENNLKTVS